MPRDVTVTFADGATHVYQGVPDEITPHAITQRAIGDFQKDVAALDGGRKAQVGDASRASGQGLLRQFAHGASFGFDDELAGAVSALTGGEYDSARRDYLAEREKYGTDHPVASFAANVAGGLAAGVGGAAKLAATKGGAAVADVVSSLPRWAQLATAGGTAGAAQGAGDADNGSRAIGALKGGVTGAAIGAAALPIANVAGSVYRRIVGLGGANVPSAEALRAAADEGYAQARGLQLQIKPEAMDAASQGIATTLRDAGYRDYLAPKTFRAVQELTGLDGSPATLADVEGVRRALNKAAADPAEKDAARRAIGHIDDFLESMGPNHVISGDASQAAGILKEARGNYAAASRANQIGEAVDKAERAAGSAGSGANIDNTTRQAIKSILNSPKKLRGFSPEEVDQMEKIVRGTFTGNAMRLLGKLAPTGIVSGPLSGAVGYAAGGPVGAVAIPIAGFAAKKGADASTRSLVAELQSSVLARSPLGRTMALFDDPVETAVSPRLAALAATSGQTLSDPLRRLLGDQSLSSSQR